MGTILRCQLLQTSLFLDNNDHNGFWQLFHTLKYSLTLTCRSPVYNTWLSMWSNKGLRTIIGPGSTTHWDLLTGIYSLASRQSRPWVQTPRRHPPQHHHGLGEEGPIHVTEMRTRSVNTMTSVTNQDRQQQGMNISWFSRGRSRPLVKTPMLILFTKSCNECEQYK